VNVYSMRDHIKILAVLNIVWSSIGILAGLVVLLVLGGLAGVVAVANAQSNDTGALFAGPLIIMVGLGILTLIALLSLPALIGSIGLLKHKSWGRTLMIVVSIFHLVSVPVGTALGVYGIWVLFHEDTRRLFETGGELMYSQGAGGV
jgi:hypothetical protein